MYLEEVPLVSSAFHLANPSPQSGCSWVPDFLDPSRDKGFSLLSLSSGHFPQLHGEGVLTQHICLEPLLDLLVHVDPPTRPRGSENGDHVPVSHEAAGLIPLSHIQQMLNAVLLSNLIFKSNILFYMIS